MFRIVWMNFRKWAGSCRVYVVLASVLVFTYIRTDSVRSYAASAGLSVTPYFFAFQMSDGITRMLFYFGLILLLCDAPFTDSQQMFVLSRTGRKKWFLGQIIYIFTVSAVYLLAVWLASVVLFIPYVGFSPRWGTVFTVCAQNNSLTGVCIPECVVEGYTPLQACAAVFLLNEGIGFLLGLVIFYGNLFRSRIFGPAIAMGWVVFSNVIVWAPEGPFRYVSPVTWAGLTSFHSRDAWVSPVYAAVFLITGCLLLGFLIMRKSKHYTIEALEEF